MKTINNFDKTISFTFYDDNAWTCFGCGRNNANCLHHIFGRGKVEGVEKSILNASPMNNHECHLPRHGYWMTTKGREYLFTRTLQHLWQIGYNLKDIDNKFLEKYALEINKFNIKI